MSARLLVIGDPHFKVSNVRETDAMAVKIVQLAQQHQPLAIVVLGDVLHRHETIHVTPLTRAISFLRQLSALAPTYLLIGNHDLKNNREFLSQEHPFTSLKQWPNMKVVDQPIRELIDGIPLVFAPYLPPGRFLEGLQGTEWQTARAIFAHQEFRGCRTGVIVSVEGDQWPVTNPLVISGHIHEYQQPQENILYVGTPIQHSFSDSPDKAIMLCTISLTNFSFERFPLGLPLKRTVALAWNELDREINSTDQVRVVISGTPSQLKSIRKHPQVEKWQKQGYQISYKTIPEQNIVSLPTAEQARYSQVLLNSLQSDPGMVALYQRILGS